MVEVAVLSDIHFDPGATPPSADRRDFMDDTLLQGDVLLQRAVCRLNKLVRPDITLLLGDFVEHGETTAGIKCLQRLRHIVNRLEGPVIAIPGNHDPGPDTFYTIFERPPAFWDVKGVRFVPFVDIQDPEYNARRTEQDLVRMAGARQGFTGTIVAVQHVPVFPPGASDCPYHYTNADEVIAAMRNNGIGLAISGHYHRGMDLIRSEGACFVATPALCEAPFRFLEVTLDGPDVQVREHALHMPEAEEEGLGFRV